MARGRVVVVLVTCPTRTVARRLAHALVQQRVAACVNVINADVESTYVWKGQVEQAREVLLVIKTSSNRFADLCRLIRSLHPYEVPEIIALPVTHGHPPYARWVLDTVDPR